MNPAMLPDVDMSTPVVSEDEERILELYDQLQALEFRLARTRAQQAYDLDTSKPVTEQMLERAREQLLDAKASHGLRKAVSENIMMVHPILNAVHGAVRASPIERDLLPYIQQRDEAAIAVAVQTNTIQEVMDRLDKVEVESIQVTRENVKLASELLELAERTKQNSTSALDDDPRVKARIEELEKEVKASRQKWRIMKDTASAVVVGSGVDWVRDEKLREMVLDED